jgi:hypothetical protein
MKRRTTVGGEAHHTLTMRGALGRRERSWISSGEEEEIGGIRYQVGAEDVRQASIFIKLQWDIDIERWIIISS